MTREATSVACPRELCKAPVGEPCNNPDGETLRRAHWERFKAARADPAVRDRGKHASPPPDARHRPSRSFNLPHDVHEWLDAQRELGANLSEVAERALRAEQERALRAEQERLKKIDTPAT